MPWTGSSYTRGGCVARFAEVRADVSPRRPAPDRHRGPSADQDRLVRLDGVVALLGGTLDVDAREDAVEPSWQPPVARAEQLHGGGNEEHPHDGGVEQD